MPTEFTTPDTTLYLILGLVVTSVIVLALIGSMVLRFRSAEQDARLIQELSEE